MRTIDRALPLLLALTAVACEPEPAPAPPPTAARSAAATPSAATASATATATASATATSAPVAAPAALASLARASNAFGFDLYAKLPPPKGNLALSPASISIALTMTWAGARAETATEMQKVLHLEGSTADVAKSSGELAAYLQDPSRPLTLRMANRLFGEKTFSFEQPYLDLGKSAFGAPLEPVDFLDGADKARVHINDWVATLTEQRVKDLIPPGEVNAATRLVLVNAIYFLANWSEPFDEKATAPAKFNTSKTESKDVPTMNRTGSFMTAAVDGAQVLDLPYKDPSMTFTVVMPDEVDGLEALEKELSVEQLARWTRPLAGERVHVALPKFKLSSAESLRLGDPLQALGMNAAFDVDKADFTGMANPPKKEDRLSIGQVFHKAFVEVDEKGTEAAAATAVVARTGGAAPAKPKEFVVDRPFLFFVREKMTGMVLFMGRVTDPAAP